MEKIELNRFEMEMACIVGVQRQLENLFEGANPAFGAGTANDWQLALEGCLGEMALAKKLGCYWEGKGVKRAPDVGQVDVRTSWHESGRLILHPTDDDDRFFCLLTGVNGSYTYRGGIFAREGKRDEYWQDPQRKNRWAYFVPQDVLRPSP